MKNLLLIVDGVVVVDDIGADTTSTVALRHTNARAGLLFFLLLLDSGGLGLALQLTQEVAEELERIVRLLQAQLDNNVLIQGENKMKKRCLPSEDAQCCAQQGTAAVQPRSRRQPSIGLLKSHVRVELLCERA